MPELTAAARAAARASARKPLSASAPPPPRPRASPRRSGGFGGSLSAAWRSNRGVPTTQCSPPDPEGKPAMSKWLSPQKMLDYHIVRRFGDVAEAERQLYLAVVRGDVRARLNGKILGPEWLKQLCRMKISEASSFALPRDIELAAEDAPRV